jgi:arylsulfatase A-like enzyme
MGAGYFAGLLSGGVNSYYNWNLTQNGQTAKTASYATSKFTDLAIGWTGAQSKPWFLWLAYNAPHSPFHLPPSELHNQGNLPKDNASIEANPLPYYLAMIEAMDSEIGRLLNSFSKETLDNTIIFFIGDNGTPSEVVQTYNNRRAKGSIYQGGINVPLIVSGKNVSRNSSNEEALINGTDLFATILDLAGTGIFEKNDSKSFKNLLSSSSSSQRKFVYSEKYNSKSFGQDYTIRNKTHKYLYFNDGSEALYDLSDNPFEFPNLLSPNQLPLNEVNSAAKNELVLQLSVIRN